MKWAAAVASPLCTTSGPPRPPVSGVPPGRAAAGAPAARPPAREGATVLPLDRARFPRDKPCGGGVTLRAAACQDLDLSPVVERIVTGARFSLRLGETFDRG